MEYVGPKAVAKHISVSLATVKRMAVDGRIPCLKLSARMLRFDLQKVDEALQKFERHGSTDAAVPPIEA